MGLNVNVRLGMAVSNLSGRAITLFVSICLLFAALTSCSTNKGLSHGIVRDSSIVFEPQNEYASMRIPALVMTKANSLLAFCEGRIGTSSDWAEMDLLMRRSTDGGKSWETPIVIASRQGPHPTSNPTPIVDSDGTIHLLYQRDYAKAYYTKSVDDGRTWSEAVISPMYLNSSNQNMIGRYLHQDLGIAFN
jgi:sialidase-1